MRKSIHLLEFGIWFGLGVLIVVAGLLSQKEAPTDPLPLFLGFAVALVYYPLYLLFLRGWTSGGGCAKISVLFFTGGAALLFFIVGDVIRRLAHLLYTGTDPVKVAFGGPLTKGPVPAAAPDPQQGESS